MIRPSALALSSLAALTLVFASVAGAAPPKAGRSDVRAKVVPQLRIVPAELAPGPDLIWSFSIEVVDSLPVGLYLDSLSCNIEDTGKGETHAPRVRRVRVPITEALPDVSGGDTGEMNYNMPATCEDGRLDFILSGHLSDKSNFTANASAIAKPGPVSADHPSQFLSVDGKPVEVVEFASQRDGPAPGVLLVAGEGTHARSLLGQGMQLAARGYHVMIVSLPGFGLSEGPGDFAGPHTVAALGAALDRLKRAAGVDSTHLGAWGVGRAAGAIATLAARRGDLTALVLLAGVYDLGAVYRETHSTETRDAITAEAGRDSSAWRDRSPILRAASVHAATIVVHGGADSIVPSGQAEAFAAAVRAGGATVDYKLVPDADHALSRPEVNRATFTFLEAHLRH